MNQLTNRPTHGKQRLKQMAKADGQRRTRATRRRMRGFTLIELMIAVAIVAILVAVGAPSFASFIDSNKVRTETQRVASLLALARNHAVNKNREVTVRIQVAAAGALDVDVYTGTGSSQEFIQKSAGAVSRLAFGLSNADIGGGATPPAPTGPTVGPTVGPGGTSSSGVVFLTNGRRKQPVGITRSANATQITVCNSGKTLGRKIAVSPVGRINISAIGNPSQDCL